MQRRALQLVRQHAHHHTVVFCAPSGCDMYMYAAANKFKLNVGPQMQLLKSWCTTGHSGSLEQSRLVPSDFQVAGQM